MAPIKLILFSLAATAASGADFGRDVHPILNRRCAACHSQSVRQGGLSVMSAADLNKGGVSGPAIRAGSSGDSLLMARITGMRQPRMPLGGDSLTEREIATIREWIEAGARVDATEKQTWIAPLALRKPDVPATGNPVEVLLNRYWVSKGVKPANVVDERVFARRAHFDLHGVPPTPAELEEFTASRRENKRTELIERLLNNRKLYAGHWISFWNDLLHNDEGVVYHGERKSITPWLLDALERNVPYNEFVASLLNPIGPSAPEGYVMGVNWRGDINASQTPAMQAAQNSAQVFLGVNIKCASCHDSFVNRWKLKDAYGLASFFSPAPLALVRCDAPTGEMAAVRFLYPELGETRPDASLAERRAAVAGLFTTKENGRFARTFVTRVWERLIGRGLVENADDMDTEPWHPDLLDWLAWDFVENGYDIHHLLRRIMTSTAYQLPAVDAPGGSGYVFRGPALRRLTAEQFADSVSAITGEWRARVSPKPEPAPLVRDWQLKASPLSRALGRPVRDLAVTVRVGEPSTLQALELVNGETLAELLVQGARRLTGEWRRPPAPVYDSGLVTNSTATVDIPLNGLKELRLLIVNQDSYDSSRVFSGWADAFFEGPSGSVSLPSMLEVPPARLRFRDTGEGEGVLAPLGKELVVPIGGKGLTRFRARAGNDLSSLSSDINPRTRFFIFAEPPEHRQLFRASSEPPIPGSPAPKEPEDLVRHLFLYAFGRPPTEPEKRLALASMHGRTTEGVEDLLWALFLSPEFQFVR